MAGAGAKAQPGEPGLGSKGNPAGGLVATPTGGVGAGAALANTTGLGEFFILMRAEPIEMFEQCLQW